MIRLLIVDDSALMRRAIREMVASDPRIEVVGAGRNGREAIELNRSLQPDVVTMDVEMPELDGLTALAAIMRDRPTKVIMLSSLTVKGSRAVAQAFAVGAADALAKECNESGAHSIDHLRSMLVERIVALGSTQSSVRATKKINIGNITYPSPLELIVIGSSTGGPAVLEKIIRSLSADTPCPVVVAQHMPAMFTQSMSERLNEICQVRVEHLTQRTPIANGTVYITQGGRHSHIRRTPGTQGRYEAIVSDEPKTAVFKPSVDALLSSAAVAAGKKILSIVLTGIGQDGMLGAKDIRAQGGHVWAQDEESCVVYGMPRAVAENGYANAVLAPHEMIECLKRLPQRNGRSAA